MDFSKSLKTQAVIEVYGRVVGRDNVQNGSGLKTALMVKNVGGQGGSVTLASMLRMRADATDFAMRTEDKALARHGDQLARLGGVPDSKIAAHKAGATAEESWERNIGQGHHRWRIGTGERRDREGWGDDGERGISRETHLETGSGTAIEQNVLNRWRISENIRSFVGFKKSMKILKGSGSVLIQTGEGSNVSRIFEGEAMGEGQVSVSAVERIPNGVGKGVVRRSHGCKDIL
jgi:hypothetical protein